MKRLDDSKGAPPLYLQISQILRDKILRHEYDYGDRIPSEKDLQDQYEVSRITARQAIQKLEQENMVERARGKGTIVTYQPCIDEYLNTIRSFTDEMKIQNMEPGSKDVRISLEKADSRIAKIFGVEEESLLYYLERVRTGSGQEIVYFQSYYTLDANLPLNEEEPIESAYAMLKEKGIIPVHVDEQFDCMMPTKLVQDKLKMEQGIPVLRRRRTAYDDQGKAIEYTIGYYRGDRYTYHLEMDLKK